MPKNYYLVLGIPSAASPEDIKDAYRRLVKEFHPDYYGENPSPFLAIQEAYAVLSDPIKRQDHDRSVRHHGRKQPVEIFSTRSPGLRSPVEPLIPEQRPAPDLTTVSLARSFHTYHPSFDQLFDRLFSNFNSSDSPRHQRIKELGVEITLTPEQAFRGGHVRLSIPAQPVCPTCSGHGWIGAYECWRCSAEGVIYGEYPVMISYPPGISDHHTVNMPLSRYGIHNLFLTVHFRISRDA